MCKGLCPTVVLASVRSVEVSSMFVVAPIVCGSFVFGPSLALNTHSDIPDMTHLSKDPLGPGVNFTSYQEYLILTVTFQI